MAMAKTLWFKRRGQGDQQWYRCGSCRDYVPRETGGAYLSLGATLLAVVCEKCAAQARLAVVEALPHSWPDVDAGGVLLYDPDAR